MSRTDHLTTTLRALDVADPQVDPTGERARADLAAILATDPTTPAHGVHAPSAPAPGRRRPAAPVRRRVLLGAAVAAATAGLVVLPPLTGGDEAFATWTATPEDLSPVASEDAAEACRASLADGAVGEHPAGLDTAVPAVAERRGAWTAVVLAGEGGFSALCVTDDSAGLFSTGMIGSVGTSGAALPGPREVAATDLGTGTMDAGDISLIAGAVGEEVVGVVHRSQEHGPVTATVNEGRFALWFPGDELWDAGRDGAEVEVTYRDGTTATVRVDLTL